MQYHANYSSFLSNSSLGNYVVNDIYTLPFCSYYCKYQKFKNPIEHLKMQWIRPEDLMLYHEIGIEFFKLDGRDKSGSFMVNVIEAYLRQKYEGNFLHLLNRRYVNNSFSEESLYSNCKIEDSEIDSAWKICIDNRDLDGFVYSLILDNHNCLGDCFGCNRCDKIKEKIRVDDVWQKQICEKLAADMRKELYG